MTDKAIRVAKLVNQINSSQKKDIIIKAIKVMKDTKIGRTDYEVQELLKQSEIPFSLLMFLLGHYSDLLEINFK